MGTSARDRNILLALLAQRNQLVASDSLTVSAEDPSLRSAAILRNLSEPDARLLDALADRLLERNGGSLDSCISLLGTEAQSLLAEPVANNTVPEPDADHTVYDAFATRIPTGETRSDRAAGDATVPHRFRRVKLHAKGGLGAVFLAHDSELNRPVALKEIHDHHADIPASRNRFLLEAEITGGLEHPGIVPVYGRGQYADGRPYYAMRFIDGVTLEARIREYHSVGEGRSALPKSLLLRHLLGIFLDVCNAVSYAHSKGIVHRDLKPANIIVGKYGETLVVDWGLAKNANSQESVFSDEPESLTPLGKSENSSVETLPGSAIGTPAFMSPEAARGELKEIGARSDVYSLGATLYNLLTGEPPFRGKDLSKIIEEVIVGTFVSPRQVDGSISPGLEAICVKAMALRPEERYENPKQLSDDIERWMADEPVSAHQERWFDRARRWSRRNRTWTRAGAASLVLVAFVAIASAFFIDASRRQEKQAKGDLQIALNRAQLLEAEARHESERATEEAKTSESVITFLASLFDETDVLGNVSRFFGVVNQGTKLSAKQILDRGAAGIDQFKEKPMVQLKLIDTLGIAYLGLGMIDQAETMFRKAVAIYQPDDPDAADSLDALGTLLVVRQDPEGIDLLRKALKLRVESLPADDLRIADTRAHLAIGLGLDSKSHDVEVESLLKQALDSHRKALPRDSQGTAAILIPYAFWELDRGRGASAIVHLREAVGYVDKLPQYQEFGTLAAKFVQGVVLEHAGLKRPAQAIYRDTIAAAEKVLGTDHYLIGFALVVYSRSVHGTGDDSLSAQKLTRALEILAPSLGPNTSRIADLRLELAGRISGTKASPEVIEAAYRAAIPSLRPNAKRYPRDLARALRSIAEIRLPTHPGDAESIEMLGEVLQLYDRAFGKKSMSSLEVLEMRANALKAAGRYLEAIHTLESARATYQANLKNDPSFTWEIKQTTLRIEECMKLEKAKPKPLKNPN